ncbi:UNVERIFIED_CONTAM: hypothetical protein DQE83_27865, partial [Escherichia coli]
GIYETKIIGANLQGTGTGNGIEMYNKTTEIIGVKAENYKNAASIAGHLYRVVQNVKIGGASIGSTGSYAIAVASADIASQVKLYEYKE